MHTVDDSVQSHQSQIRERQAVAETNSLNSNIKGVPRILCNTSKRGQGAPGATGRKKNNRRKKCGRHWSSSARPTPAGFHLSGIGDSILNSSGLKFSHIWFSPSCFLAHLTTHHEVLDLQSIRRFWTLSLLGPLLVRIGGTHFLLQSWSRPVETGLDRSCPVSTVHHRSLSTRSFCSSTDHDVLECQTHHEFVDCGAAAAFQKLRLGTVCGADCGAAAACKKSSVSLFTLIIFQLCVM